MRTLLILFLSCLTCFGQFSRTAAFRGAAVTKAAAGGGGGSPSGPPGLDSVFTNTLTTATNRLNIPVTSQSGSNRMEIVASWQVGVDISTVTNDTSQTAIFVTNLTTSVEAGGVWAFTNPPAASHVVSIVYGGSASQSGALLAVLTNTTAVFGNKYVSRVGSTAALSNLVVSATKELVVTFDGADDTSGAPVPILHPSMTLKGIAQTGASAQTLILAIQEGLTSCSNSVSWVGQPVDDHSKTIVCIQGPGP